jgi:hypothetical protein
MHDFQCLMQFCFIFPSDKNLFFLSKVHKGKKNKNKGDEGRVK